MLGGDLAGLPLENQLDWALKFALASFLQMFDVGAQLDQLEFYSGFPLPCLFEGQAAGPDFPFERFDASPKLFEGLGNLIGFPLGLLTAALMLLGFLFELDVVGKQLFAFRLPTYRLGGDLVAAFLVLGNP